MKIVLKGADFSQSGIPVPHEVVLDGSKYLNAFTGALEDNSSTARGADVSVIPMSNNKVKNTSNVAISLSLLFYDSNNTYIGCASSSRTGGAVVLGAGGSIMLNQAPYYDKSNGSFPLIEMTEQEISAMFAAATYYKIAVQVGSGTIDDASIELEIVE